MKVYIRNTANISPQRSLDPDCFLKNITEYESVSMKCIEPDYSQFLSNSDTPGRILKMGIAAAKLCLDNTDVMVPDAVITATGLGCIENTENFMISMIENDEKLLPGNNAFRSTYNPLCAHIAMEINCPNYSCNYVHRSFSFESALLDSMIMLTEKECANVLVGAAAEHTASSIEIFSRLGLLKRNPLKNTELYNVFSKGFIAGEGSAFFLLTNECHPDDLAILKAVSTFFNPYGTLLINSEILSFLIDNELSKDDIDLVIYGDNGDSKTDLYYDNVRKNSLKGISAARYKHLCGEYCTSSSFAMWLASNIIHLQNIPDIIHIDKKPDKSINNILIYNQFRNKEHSLILISNN